MSSHCKYECGGEGLVWLPAEAGSTRMFRCTCPAGERHAYPMYRAGDRKRERPVFIAVAGSVPASVPPSTRHAPRCGRELAAGRDD